MSTYVWVKTPEGWISGRINWQTDHMFSATLLVCDIPDMDNPPYWLKLQDTHPDQPEKQNG